MITVNHFLVGKRVQLAPHTDEWMSGDRYGRITAVDGGRVFILLDRSFRNIRKRMTYLDTVTFL